MFKNKNKNATYESIKDSKKISAKLRLIVQYTKHPHVFHSFTIVLVFLFFIAVFSTLRAASPLFLIGSPTQLSPVDESIIKTTPILEWEALEGATNYHIEYTKTGDEDYSRATFIQTDDDAVTYTISNLKTGEYKWRVRGLGEIKNVSPWSRDLTFNYVGGATTREVDGKTISIVEAEDFRPGGQGAGYFDTTEENQGDGGCRESSVDLITDVEDCVIGWFKKSEWLEYEVDIETDGSYSIGLNASNGSSKAAKSLLSYDSEPQQEVVINNSNNWDFYKLHQAENVQLKQGRHTIRVTNLNGEFNLDYLEFEGPGEVLVRLASKIEAEDYKFGGEGIAYHDTTEGNLGGGQCRDDDVDLHKIPGGCVVGWFESSEWMEYKINSEESGVFSIELIISRGNSGNALARFAANDKNSSEIVIPSTGRWNKFEKVLVRNIELNKGENVLRLSNTAEDFNVSYFLIVGPGEVKNSAVDASTGESPSRIISSSGDAIAAVVNNNPGTSGGSDSIDTSPPCSGVDIYPGDDINNIINNGNAGTTYCIKAGVHSASFRVKSDMSIIGQNGAIFDGGGSLPHAIEAHNSDNVHINNLEIRNYNNPNKLGTISRGNQNSGGWLIENNEIHNNTETGITTAREWTIRDNHIHHNGRYALSGAGYDIVVEGNELSYNSNIIDSGGADSGTMKYVFTDDIIIRNNYVHNNYGNGIWVDINNARSVITGNVVENNKQKGIFVEISCGATVRDNYLEGNNYMTDPYPTVMAVQATISIANSPDVEVYDNTLVDNNGKGIGAWNWNHPNLGGTVKCTPELRNLDVHDNDVDHSSGGVAGISAGVDATNVYNNWNNRFYDNNYTIDGSAQFRWDNAWHTYTEWQGLGNN